MGGTVAEAEAALGADLNHVASGRLVCAAQGIDSIYVLHFFLFLWLDYNQVITILTVGHLLPHHIQIDIHVVLRRGIKYPSRLLRGRQRQGQRPRRDAVGSLLAAFYTIQIEKLGNIQTRHTILRTIQILQRRQPV